MYHRRQADKIAHPVRPDHRARVAAQPRQGSPNRPRPCRQSPASRARDRYSFRRPRRRRVQSKPRQGPPGPGTEHNTLSRMPLRAAATGQRMSSMRVQDICRDGGTGAGRRACRTRVASVRFSQRPSQAGMRQKGPLARRACQNRQAKRLCQGACVPPARAHVRQ